jgi:glycerol-3-phosphate dehydrogenase
MLGRVEIDTPFDLIVIGGGINGTAIARDAAIRGLRTLLLEKEDLSSATSAWNSRMIHGGLKYLEHFEIGLVRESLREREWLLRAAPHLVKPLLFMMPFLERNRRGRLMLRCGMVAYDLLSYDKSLAPHRILRKEDALRAATGLDAGELKGAALYYDAQATYAERLSLENAIAAEEHGAAILTHSKVTRLIMEGRQIVGVEYEDQLTRSRGTARGTLTVNAAGPWVDSVLAGAALSVPRLIGGTKGTHFVIDPFPGGPQHAMYYEAISDGRPLMIIPWAGRYLIGSTDLRFEGDPDDARADKDETDYILRETNALFPDAGLTAESVRFSYTGVRPLPYEPGVSEAKVTRRHVIHDHAPEVEGLVSIVGGKLTTFRSLAEDAVNLVLKKLGVRGRRCTSAWEPLPGGRTADYGNYARNFVEHSGLTPEVSRHILSIYGTRSLGLMNLAASDAGLTRAIWPGQLTIGAEVIFALRAESARTITDVMMRRLMAGLNPDLDASAAEAIGVIAQQYERWSDGRVADDLDNYRRYAARFRPSAAEGVDPWGARTQSVGPRG